MTKVQRVKFYLEAANAYLIKYVEYEDNLEQAILKEAQDMKAIGYNIL
jgi:hypothetical protein|nr:MAG TPA: hypothetical protein [Caudoviricetes sp.]